MKKAGRPRKGHDKLKSFNLPLRQIDQQKIYRLATIRGISCRKYLREIILKQINIDDIKISVDIDEINE